MDKDALLTAIKALPVARIKDIHKSLCDELGVLFDGFDQLSPAQKRATIERAQEIRRAKRMLREGAVEVRTRKWATRISKQYGINADDYVGMLRLQDGVCAICRSRQKDIRRLVVDHDHGTGAVRGLLCSHCNSALGFLRDSPAAAREAAAYLEKHRSRAKDRVKPSGLIRRADHKENSQGAVVQLVAVAK